MDEMTKNMPKEDRRTLKGFLTSKGSGMVTIFGITSLTKSFADVQLPMIYIGIFVLASSLVFYYSVNSRKNNPPVLEDDGYTLLWSTFSWKNLKSTKKP